MGDYDRPVQAGPAVLAHLRHRFDTDLGSIELAEYARSLGLEPPDDPPGYEGWAIIEKFPPGLDKGVLYWWGPEEEDHGEDDVPKAGIRANQHLIELYQWGVIRPGECEECGQENWQPGYDNGTETDYIGFQCLGCGNIVGMVRSEPEDEGDTVRYERTGYPP